MVFDQETINEANSCVHQTAVICLRVSMSFLTFENKSERKADREKEREVPTKQKAHIN